MAIDKEGTKRRGPMPSGASSLSRGGSVETVLRPAFYERTAAEVARDLLGKVIVSDIGDHRTAGVIVETEAYTGPEDEASHAAARIGRTRRNAAMFGSAGIAYVYRIYGVHWCLNAVCDAVGHPSAVLIRAAEPLLGLEVMRARRPGRPDRDLMRGPGNLCLALGITGEFDHHPLQEPPLFLAEYASVGDSRVRRGPRIGISRAADLPLRFWLADNPYVSGRT